MRGPTLGTGVREGELKELAQWEEGPSGPLAKTPPTHSPPCLEISSVCVCARMCTCVCRCARMYGCKPLDLGLLLFQQGSQ